MARENPRLKALIQKQAEAIFPNEEDQQAFIAALAAGESREVAMLMLEDRPEIRAFPKLPPLPWQPDYVVRVAEHFRPGRHPLHEKGAFYILDLSSVFAASAMRAILGPVRRVLDLCSSPGGKSVFAWRTFRPEVLVASETIRKRTIPLISNFDRCKVQAGRVGSADPSVWGRKAKGCFDLVIVDAPCSGQSLIAKGIDAEDSFDPKNIEMCHSRQRRILGNAMLTVAPGGHVLYMTCTYSRKENEKIVDWALKEFPEFHAVEVSALHDYQSWHTETPCYRLSPQDGIGAGAFTALLQRKGDPPEELPPLENVPIFWRYGDPAQRQAPTHPVEEKKKPEEFKVEEKRPKRQHFPPKAKGPVKPPPKRPPGRKKKR